MRMDVGNWLVWQALKLYVPPGTRLTAVRRTAQEQLNFIVRKARAGGYQFTKPALLSDPTSWRDALAFVRSKVWKVAAPGESKHQSGLAYDLAGPDLAKVEAAVRKAAADGRITLVRTSRNPILREVVNRCVHVEIESGLLDFEPFEYA
jgi:hypothetical protein